MKSWSILKWRDLKLLQILILILKQTTILEKVDQNYLYDVLSKIDLNGAEALFVSCTALPVLSIIDKLEKKLNIAVLSSNQALIWDTLVKIDKNNSVEGFGKLFQSN